MLGEIENLKNDAYWSGYIDKQNQSVEICKQCKYIKNNKIKDKMIDDMTDFIDDNLTDCILNTMNIDEPCSKHANRGMPCKECIKEYFRN